MKKNTSKKGFSLVETIVYVAIFSMFIIGLANFSNSLTSMRVHTQMVLEVNDQGSRAIKIITQTLRNANSVTNPTVGNAASGVSVITAIPATSPTLFSLSNGVLYMTEGSGSPIALTNNKVIVSNLLFSNFSRINTPNIIKINFTLTSVSVRDPYTVTFSGSGVLRK